jgi:prepilin-type N-terminal cleavage/methylation domain-containing protein
VIKQIHYRRSQRGDTIVEVLIAIAVVGIVIAVSYSIMNRNLMIMRDNQERTESVKLAQGQVEALKSLWGTALGQSQINAQVGNGFCLSGDGATPVLVLNGNAPTANMASDVYSNYVAGCINQGIFHIGVRRSGTSPNFSYKVTVRWDQVGTGQRRESSIVYRLR